jgi:hypothetical protein
MNNIQDNNGNAPAPEVEQQGEKVTGGEEKTEDAPAREENTTSGDQQNDEYTPATETSKEEMTGYNELPDQEKVGGA